MDGNVDRGEALAILGAAVSLGHQQILHHVHIVLQCHHALAVVVTPLSVAAPFWNKLLRASVVQNAEGYLRIRRQPARLDSDVAGELAIFAVDFAPYSTRIRVDV